MAEPSSLPLVSVVIAARNEAPYIEDAVRNVLENGYPLDRLEVLVVDGMSDDGTADIVRRLAAEDPHVRLVENPRKITPVAFNLGIQASRGEIVVILGAHGRIAPSYLNGVVRVLREHPEVWAAGGRPESIAAGYMGQVIGAAMSCPVGAGNARYSFGNYTGYVDTVSYCGFRKWVFERIGLFDEELVRNQDDDFSFRILRAGGKIYVDISISYGYVARGSLTKLFTQYFQYGTWRIRTIQKHGRPATLRQTVPLGFVSLWILLAVGAIFSPVAAGALVAYAGLYAVALMVGAVQVARRAGWRYAPAAPLAFMVMHFGYGIGSLYGIFVFCLRPSRRAKPQKHPPAR